MRNNDFQEKIGYSFADPALLETALTHSSYCHEGKRDGLFSNERLEFLGDSILNATIGESLYLRAFDVEEGKLTKLRAQVVCERSLAECARRYSLAEVLKLGRGEELSGGRERESILADAMEALIGAVFLDGGYEQARKFVLRVFDPTMAKALAGNLHSDFKTEIQEKLQANGAGEILYRIDREEGPDHQKTFYVSLWHGGEKLGEGRGRSKKEAEQNAAKAALEE